jgi:hypothetical protein
MLIWREFALYRKRLWITGFARAQSGATLDLNTRGGYFGPIASGMLLA